MTVRTRLARFYVALMGTGSVGKKFPDARGIVDPSTGPGCALLRLQISSPHGCGVAGGLELTANPWGFVCPTIGKLSHEVQGPAIQTAKHLARPAPLSQ